MKNKNKLRVAFCLTLLLGGIAQAMKEDAATTFVDINADSEYFDGINWAINEGVAVGYGDRTWKPDACVTRAELVKMSFEAIPGDEMADKSTYSAPFTDIKPTDWYYKYANEAKKLGYITGYEDGSFRGTECVNRAEAMKVSVNMMINSPMLDKSTDPVYCGENLVKDIDGSSWYAPYARFLMSDQLIGMNHALSDDKDGKKDRKDKQDKKTEINYKPADKMSRKEVAEMLYLVKHSSKYNK